MATILNFTRIETKSMIIYNEIKGKCDGYIEEFLENQKYFPINSPKKWKFRFSKDTTKLLDGTLFELINISGFQDNIMVEAAKKYSLPRGLKLLKINDKYISYGFYPKFSNDPNKQEKITIPENTTKLEFFKKYSGFLGLMFGFKYQNENYIIITSKNSACNIYSENAKKILSKYLNEKLINEICGSKKTLGFEIMCKEDQTHGSLVYKEAPIITCISESFNMTINYFNLNEVIEFAKNFGLPFSSLYTIETRENINEFCEALFKIRDVITNELFDNLITKSFIKINSGVLTHQEILGNVLEGLVFHFYENDNKHIVKIKFPNYIVRTMVLRICMTGSLNPYNITEKIIPNWVMSKENEKFWKSFCFLCFEEYNQNTDLYKGNTSSHIIIANKIYDNMISSYGSLENAFKFDHGYFKEDNDNIEISLDEMTTKEFNINEKYSITIDDIKLKFQASIIKSNINPKTTLFMMSGIPGTGKTTIAKYIATNNHIPMFAADDFFCETQIPYDYHYLMCAHRLCQYNTYTELLKGNSVIVHNTSTTLQEMKPYFAMGFDKIVVIRPTTQFESLHNIETKTMENMKKRLIPLNNIVYDNVLKINEKKPQNKALQARIYLNENNHITLEYHRNYDEEIVNKFIPYCGLPVVLSYGNILVHKEDNRHLETQEVKILNNPGIEITKTYLHVTLKAENIEPSKSNDLLEGKLKLTHKYSSNCELTKQGIIVLYS